MKYKAEITIDEDLYDILKAEMQTRSRTNEKLSRDGKKTKITIISEDSTALRGSLNSLTKLCTVYEKMKDL